MRVRVWPVVVLVAGAFAVSGCGNGDNFEFCDGCSASPTPSVTPSATPTASATPTGATPTTTPAATTSTPGTPTPGAAPTP